MRSALGLESELQTNPDPELLQKVLTVFHVPLYIRALSMFPFWQQVKKLFDINPIQHVRYFEKLGRKVLEIRKKSPSGRRDLFQLMLEAKEESVKGTQKLTDEEIIAQTSHSGGWVPVHSIYVGFFCLLPRSSSGDTRKATTGNPRSRKVN